MPAKSFIGTMGDAARVFYATVLRGEVSDANVRGYLRSAEQIADLWRQADENVAATIAAGATPWDAYQRWRYALALTRAARSYQVFVQELLAADAAMDPATAGFLPHVTYDQANALCHQIQPNVAGAAGCLADPSHVPDLPLPQPLQPRVEAEGAPCPVAHLQGMISAAREVRGWAAGLIAEYEQAVTHATTPAPSNITDHLAALHRELAEADSQLRFGTDLVGQVSQGQATPELHERAEDQLWAALERFFLINQVVAMPQWQAVPAPVAAPQRRYRDQRVTPEDLWRVAAPSARAELRGTEFGTDELTEMCEKMGGILSAGAQQYLDEVDAAVRRGDALIIAAMANCPFEPLYRARVALDLAGAPIPASYEFHWNFHRGHIEVAPRFGRVDGWQECEE